MEKRTLGKTGLQVTSIGMGCVTCGREIDRETSFTVLDRAWEHGITLFDTAAGYGEGASEDVLGDWITQRGHRDQIVLASKVNGRLDRKSILDSTEQSLKRLRTDRIDLFQLHNWDGQTPLEETLETLDQLVEQGKVLHLGVSNWEVWHLAKALITSQEKGWRRFESVQPSYNLVMREIERDMLPLCSDQQIGMLTYSPRGAGFLTGKYQRGADVPKGTRFHVIPGHQDLYFTDRGYRVLELLELKSKQIGQSVADLALAWVFGRPMVTSVLIGARHPDQIDQAIKAQNTKLPDDLRKELDLM